jgi:glycine betaine/choline ABC-type transport system substrate-binding protein
MDRIFNKVEPEVAERILRSFLNKPEGLYAFKHLYNMFADGTMTYVSEDATIKALADQQRAYVVHYLKSLIDFNDEE